MLVKGLHNEGLNAYRDAQQVYQGSLTTTMAPADKKRNELLDKLWGKLQRKEIAPESFLQKVSQEVEPQECMIESRIDLDADDLEDMDYDEDVM